MRNLGIGIIIASVLVIVGVLAITSTADEEIKIVEENKELKVDLNKELKDTFVGACEENKAFCACWYDRIYEQHGLSGVIEISENWTKYGYDIRAEEAMWGCVHLVNEF